MEKQETIFRQKSIDRVSSPEQLDNYLKVTSPSVWVALIGIIIILVGAIAWGVFGKMKTYTYCGCAIENGTAHCYVKEEEIYKIKTGMPVEIPVLDNAGFDIEAIAKAGTNVPKDYNYLLHILNIDASAFVFEVQAQCDIEEGFYQGRIVVESISPIKYIYN